MTAVTAEVITLEVARARYDGLLERIGDRADRERRAGSYELDAQDRALHDDLVEPEHLRGDER